MFTNYCLSRDPDEVTAALTGLLASDEGCRVQHAAAIGADPMTDEELEGVVDTARRVMRGELVASPLMTVGFARALLQVLERERAVTAERREYR